MESQKTKVRVKNTKAVCEKLARNTVTKSTRTSADTVTSTEGDAEICILPDVVGSREMTDFRRRNHRETRTSSPPVETPSRPKRNAARAADSKIKSLVNNSLETVSLEEVDQPITQQCANCKKMKLCRFTASGKSICSENCHQQWSRLEVDAPLVRSCAQCCIQLLNDGFLTWEAMDFCKEDCLSKYQTALGSHCVNCQKTVEIPKMGKFCVRFGHEIKQFCTHVCLEEHKKVLKVCSYCQKDISSGVDGFLAPVGNKGLFKDFCSQVCMTRYEQIGCAPTEDVAECAVCSHRKRVDIEVIVGPKLNKLCSEPCFAAFKFVNNVSEGRCSQCNKYFDKMQAGRVHIYTEDSTLIFCGKSCLNVHILATRQIVSCSNCKVKKYNFDMIRKIVNGSPVMACSLECLSQSRGVCYVCGQPMTTPTIMTAPDGSAVMCCSYRCLSTYKKQPSQVISMTNNSDQVPHHTESVGTQVYQHIVTKPEEPKQLKNKSVICKPYTHNKGTSCRPMPCYKATQTDDSLTRKYLVPVPVPIYIPTPMHMFSAPFPVPTPFPLPIPVPIFIPTTRNSAKGIFKEIKKIQEKIPTDPFEAELLMMAEMVAGEKKQDPTDSESEEGGADGDVQSFSPEAVDTSNTFGDDIMQMALKMASELEEPAVDMEAVLTTSTITPSQQSNADAKPLYVSDSDESAHTLAVARGRKRTLRGGRGVAIASKRGRRSEVPHTMAPPEPVSQPRLVEVEKPDANLCLKYTFGVNAWRHWVMQKNSELEKAALTNRKIKPFKPDLLQLTADELNFSLCLFVKEVKKPSGQEYAPDTIYYLCLGIQQYLFENGRIDNIFTDAYYEKFTDCLDEVAKKFAALYNDSQFVVTRVEEEHLWESKQLGAHSPHVLLNTLMFFNTKHFNLVTVEEHMQLSFSHIMKHWKRNPNSPGVAKVPGSRNVLLRFYPPQSALEANARKKKVYEQQENEENPLRCPVKLYEFYLSKCPESVKTRNDVFYLLPERSCVPDSPVWYSTMALGREPLVKMLHRVKMVKEINVAVLSS